MSHSSSVPALLRDPEFFAQLTTFDDDLAAEARKEGCPHCGGALHAANFPRKPRGAPFDLGEDYERRLSFCCADCRRRATPRSMRFLGRKLYLGAVVLLVGAMQHGVSPQRANRLRDFFGVDRRTLARWRVWWLSTFAESPFWRSARAMLREPAASESLPSSLLTCFGGTEQERLDSTLRFLLPVTSAPGLQSSVM